MSNCVSSICSLSKNTSSVPTSSWTTCIITDTWRAWPYWRWQITVSDDFTMFTMPSNGITSPLLCFNKTRCQLSSNDVCVVSFTGLVRYISSANLWITCQKTNPANVRLRIVHKITKPCDKVAVVTHDGCNVGKCGIYSSPAVWAKEISPVDRDMVPSCAAMLPTWWDTTSNHQTLEDYLELAARWIVLSTPLKKKKKTY